MNILKKLGYITTTEYLANERKLKDEIALLQVRISQLEKRTQKDISLVDIDLNDPEPTTEFRRNYVGQVAGFFVDILEPKLKFMLSKVHSLMEDAETDNKRQQQLIGAVYSLREILFWGRSMLGEHISYQQEDADKPDEEFKQLKDLIK